MTNKFKMTLKRMKKMDSKVCYKKLHLDPIKETENSKHLKGEFYVNSVLDDMSYEELYGWMTNFIG